MARNPLPLSLIAALIMVLGAVFAPTALAEDTRLDVSVASSPTQVTVSGTLLANDKPLKRREVTALIDGKEVGRSITRGNGTFTISANLGQALAPGTHAATVRFAGGDGASPATTIVNFQIGGAATNPDASAVDPALPPVAPTLKLSVSGPDDAINSEVIELNGRVVDASGSGVGGAGISVHDGSGEVDDSFTVSNSNGSFTTWYVVPDDQAEGNLKLSLVAEGAGTARATLTIPVTRTEIEPPSSPTPTPAASPSPSPSATPSPTQTPTPTAISKDSPTASLTIDTRTGPISALLGATLGVAVLATICLGAVTAWVRRRRAAPDPTGELEFFTEDEEIAPTGAPRRGLRAP